MSFWKKLFGKTEEETAIASVSSWKNAGWADFEYLHRQGKALVRVAYDPAFLSPDAREAYSHCLRVVLNLPPALQDIQGQPQDHTSKQIPNWEKSLVKLVSEAVSNGRLVGRIQYRGAVEWVFMIIPDGEWSDAISVWKNGLGDLPAVFAEVIEGWGHYDTYLMPGKRERLMAQAKQKMDDLRNAGTNQEVLHQLKHAFTGNVAQIQALRAILEEAKYWIEVISATNLTAFRGVAFTWEAIQADMLAVMELAAKAEAEYEGWNARVVKRQVLAGSDQNGWGELMFAKGSVYSGNFVNGQMHGKGKIVYESGEWYEGDWDLGKRTGQGVYRWGPTEWYEGGFLEGKLHGQGTYHFANGNIYAGQWVNDVREGIGQLTWKDGSMYVGDWKDGKRSGTGRLNYANPPEWVEGGFLDNKIHGNVWEFSAKQGKVIYKRWIEDRMVEILKMPEVTKTWSWAATADQPGPASKNRLEDHARHALAAGLVPVVYFRSSSAAAASQLAPYAHLPAIAEALSSACILELVDYPAEQKVQLGLNEHVLLAKLDANGKPTGKTVDQPVWFTDRMEQAKAKLDYFMMP